MSEERLLDDPVCTLSHDAGGFYCGHVFYLLQGLGSVLSQNAQGQTRAGFLHVPDDRTRSAVDRFAALRRVLSAALIGAAADLQQTGDPPTVLVTGFGPFLDVADNPTGAFVGSPEQQALLRQQHPDLTLGFAVLPVDDRCLDPGEPSSVIKAISKHRPAAVIAMGVARSRCAFTVETVPDDSGLEHQRHYRHVRHLPARQLGPAAPWLADCVRRGARGAP